MRYTFILLVCLLFTFPVFSQEYEFEELSGNYTELADPVSFTNQECWDEVNFILNTDLPISSWFGNPVNQLIIQDSRVIIGDLTQGNVLAPFSTNLWCNAIDPTVSNIGYELTTDNSTGEKLLKIEWKESGFAYLEGFFDLINFQCWIYESGIVEFHYGVGATSLAEISYEENGETFGGLCGISNGFTEAYYLEGPSDNYTFNFGLINPNDLPLLTSFPMEGSIYRFSPKQSSSIYDTAQLKEISLTNSLVTSELQLNFKQNHTQADFSITNINGNRLIVGIVDTTNPIIDVNSLHSGIYFLNLMYEGEIRSFKFYKK
jgi:hypothetical protein